jgi:hypothetical protein
MTRMAKGQGIEQGPLPPDGANLAAAPEAFIPESLRGEPWESGEFSKSVAAVSYPPSNATLRVLIVEDTPHDAERTLLALRRMGRSIVSDEPRVIRMAFPEMSISALLR